MNPEEARGAARLPDPPERQRLIRELAYRRAQARGFAPGHELEDWLAAEQTVDCWFDGSRFSGD